MTFLIVCLCSVVAWAITATIFAYSERGLRRRVEHDLCLLSTRPLTVQELAEKKRVHPSTISKLIRKGEIKAEKVGRQWRIGPGVK